MGTDHEGTPDTVWVRHGDTITGFHMACPDARPYSTVRWARDNSGWRPGDPVEPVVIHRVDDSAITVLGSGISPEDPMYCPELRDRPGPVCRCADMAASLAEWGGHDDEDGEGPAEEYWDPQPVRGAAPGGVVPRETIVYLPGDGTL